MIGRESHSVGSRGRLCCRMESRDTQTETGDARVGERTHAVGGDAGTEAGDARVGR